MFTFLLALVVFGLLLAISLRGLILSEKAVKNGTSRSGTLQPAEAQASPKA